MEKIYNKLVRDLIPEIIEKDNKVPYTKILTDDEYKVELEKKVYEELKLAIDKNYVDKFWIGSKN